MAAWYGINCRTGFSEHHFWYFFLCLCQAMQADFLQPSETTITLVFWALDVIMIVSMIIEHIESIIDTVKRRRKRSELTTRMLVIVARVFFCPIWVLAWVISWASLEGRTTACGSFCAQRRRAAAPSWRMFHIRGASFWNGAVDGSVRRRSKFWYPFWNGGEGGDRLFSIIVYIREKEP